MVLPGNGRSIPELVGKHFTTGDLLQVGKNPYKII
jgi:hypothetical protein